MDCINACSVCCATCCHRCCPNVEWPCFGKKTKAKKKYPYIEYYEPAKAIDVADRPEQAYHKVPLEKIFEFPQESREFRPHPQVARRSLDANILISQQPQAVQSEQGFEPMYITSRGRTIGTVSELPTPETSPDESFEVPPFTPPPEGDTHVLESAFLPVGEEPSLQFSIYYDIQRRVLAVNLLCAYNMPGKEMWGSLDFVVSLFLLPSREEVHQSKIRSGTRNPLFSETFNFHSIVSEELYEQVLVFQVFTHDKFTRDHLVGTVVVPLKEADLFGVTMVKNIGDGREILQVSPLFLNKLYCYKFDSVRERS